MGKGNFGPLPTWTGIWGLFVLDQGMKEFEYGLDSIWNWLHHLMSMKLLSPQSLQGSYHYLS